VRRIERVCQRGATSAIGRVRSVIGIWLTVKLVVGVGRRRRVRRVAVVVVPVLGFVCLWFVSIFFVKDTTGIPLGSETLGE